MEEINYFRLNEILEDKYYQIPQELFVSSLYKNKLNSDSKILYAFLLDRLSLSQKNHWFDEYGRVYLIFTREEVQNKLNLSDKTATKAFKQLSEVNLVSEKRQGLGKPNLIYVGKIQHEELKLNTETENLQFLNRKNYDSGKGELVEVTNREHYSIQKYKKITNYENTKEVLKNIKLELPETPDIKDFKKIMINRDEKIANEIIKPKDNLIKELYTENVTLHKELSKQTIIIDKAEKFEKERKALEKNYSELQTKYRDLEINFTEKEKDLKYKYEDEIYQIDYKYQKIINKMEKENNYLKKVIDKFKVTVEKFITWVCHTFSVPSEDQIIRDFEKETYTTFDVEKQLDIDYFEKGEQEDELEY